GRISEEKGLLHLVRCFPKVLEQVPGARLRIGGVAFTARGEAYLKLVEGEITALGLTGNLEFVGEVTDARTFLEEADVVALPSEKEGLGQVMLEAMAMGKALASFASGGPTEVISDQENGLIVPVGDTAGLAAAIARLLKDPLLAKRLGLAARRTVVDSYSSEKLTPQLADIYSDICPRSGLE
ncbi:MAG TPA: glycosyltransferase family 4 protein, partial [bacterium]|nr:glycosyltransferase family 4 protein [bacterium]